MKLTVLRPSAAHPHLATAEAQDWEGVLIVHQGRVTPLAALECVGSLKGETRPENSPFFIQFQVQITPCQVADELQAENAKDIEHEEEPTKVKADAMKAPLSTGIYSRKANSLHNSNSSKGTMHRWRSSWAAHSCVWRWDEGGGIMNGSINHEYGHHEFVHLVLYDVDSCRHVRRAKDGEGKGQS